MKDTNRYANMFKTGQYGRLYLVSGRHARGNTFHIFVLPQNEPAIPNYDFAPLNKEAVEVYGITGGHPGWTETYGWLHEGRWIEDFAKLCADRQKEIEAAKELLGAEVINWEKRENARKLELLEKY